MPPELEGHDWQRPPILQATRFQLMVTAALLGDADAAAGWHESLQGEKAVWADAFWEQYQTSGDIRAACADASRTADARAFADIGYSHATFADLTCLFR